jgi:hypothetical protein
MTFPVSRMSRERKLGLDFGLPPPDMGGVIGRERVETTACEPPSLSSTLRGDNTKAPSFVLEDKGDGSGDVEEVGREEGGEGEEDAECDAAARPAADGCWRLAEHERVIIPGGSCNSVGSCVFAGVAGSAGVAMEAPPFPPAL